MAAAAAAAATRPMQWADTSRCPDWVRRSLRLSIALIVFGLARLNPPAWLAADLRSEWSRSCAWAAITCIVVNAPIIGRVVQTSVERTLGTVLGGSLGFLAYDYGSRSFDDPYEGSAFLVIAGAAVGALSCYLAVALSLDMTPRFFCLTFVLVTMGAPAYKSALAVASLRTCGILAGVIMMQVLAVLVLPRSATVESIRDVQRALQALEELSDVVWGSHPLTALTPITDTPDPSVRSGRVAEHLILAAANGGGGGGGGAAVAGLAAGAGGGSAPPGAPAGDAKANAAHSGSDAAAAPGSRGREGGWLARWLWGAGRTGRGAAAAGTPGALRQPLLGGGQEEGGGSSDASSSGHDAKARLEAVVVVAAGVTPAAVAAAQGPGGAAHTHTQRLPCGHGMPRVPSYSQLRASTTFTVKKRAQDCEKKLAAVYSAQAACDENMKMSAAEVYVWHFWGHYVFAPGMPNLGKLYTHRSRTRGCGRWPLQPELVGNLMDSVRRLSRLLWNTHIALSEFTPEIQELVEAVYPEGLLHRLAASVKGALSELRAAFPSAMPIASPRGLADATELLHDLQAASDAHHKVLVDRLMQTATARALTLRSMRRNATLLPRPPVLPSVVASRAAAAAAASTLPPALARSLSSWPASAGSAPPSASPVALLQAPPQQQVTTGLGRSPEGPGWMWGAGGWSPTGLAQQQQLAAGAGVAAPGSEAAAVGALRSVSALPVTAVAAAMVAVTDTPSQAAQPAGGGGAGESAPAAPIAAAASDATRRGASPDPKPSTLPPKPPGRSGLGGAHAPQPAATDGPHTVRDDAAAAAGASAGAGAGVAAATTTAAAAAAAPSVKPALTNVRTRPAADAVERQMSGRLAAHAAVTPSSAGVSPHGGSEASGPPDQEAPQGAGVMFANTPEGHIAQVRWASFEWLMDQLGDELEELYAAAVAVAGALPYPIH